MRLRRRLLFLALAACLILTRASIVDWHCVTGSSMQPTLRSGDLVLCDRLAYGLWLPGCDWPCLQWQRPRPGDVVLFWCPTAGRVCIKRVALPPLDHAPLPPDQIWLLGDNSLTSLDSRTFGAVPLAYVHGRALGIPAAPR